LFQVHPRIEGASATEMIPCVSRYDSDKLRDLKISGEGRNLGLPSNLNHRSSTIRGRIGLAGCRVCRHSIKIRLGKILAHVFLEVL
jgi:hypothetical protein